MNLKKYFGEGLLIVFSVLFALLINKIYEDAKTNKYKNNAIKQIRTELLNNQKTLKDWMADHNAILENLNSLIENINDSIQLLSESKSYIPIQIILDNKGLIIIPLSNSAWNSAQSIGIISEFDFNTLQKISETYELQQLIIDTSIEKIAERLCLKISDIENTKDVLIEMRLRFQSLLGQEVRERLIKGQPLVLNADANWNRTGLQTKEHYLEYYMAKNLYRLETPLTSEYNTETWETGKEITYVELLPLDGIEQTPRKKEQTNTKTGVKIINYKTNNPDLFWVKPE